MTASVPPSDAADRRATDRPLRLSEKFAYGAGDAGTALTANLLVFFLMFFLTEVAGMPSALAGRILLVGKISDAINDPVIGVLSDRTRSRWGRRYPWMIAGAVPFGVLFFLQWLVPSQNAGILFVYYLVVAVLFNLAYTAVNLPYTALTPELTRDYNERTELNSFRFAFSIGSSILSLILAQVIFGIVADPYRRYAVLGGLSAVLAVVPIFWCVAGTYRRTLGRDRPRSARNAPPAAGANSPSLWQQVAIALRSRPFQIVIGIYLCSWLAVQLTATILPYFVTNWMELPESAFPSVALAVQGTALLMLFVWNRASQRLGKRKVYFAGTGLWVLAQIGLVFLQPGQVGLMYALAVLAGTGVSTAYLVPWSMLPDVIDRDELETGQRREGVFYAFMVFLQKMGLALGLWLVGEALGWAGYVERVAGEPPPVQPDSALLAIRIAVGPLPMVALLGGVALAYFYPITREVHSAILLRLAERERAASSATEGDDRGPE